MKEKLRVLFAAFEAAPFMKTGGLGDVAVRQFDLLNLFMSNIGKIYSRDELLETIWGFDYIGDFRTVDVHIRRLREKIEKDPANPKHIMTKWGVGYYFAE